MYLCRVAFLTCTCARCKCRSPHLEQEEYDAERTAFFESKGYRILRFWNNDVLNNLDEVLKVIWSALSD